MYHAFTRAIRIRVMIVEFFLRAIGDRPVKFKAVRVVAQRKIDLLDRYRLDSR